MKKKHMNEALALLAADSTKRAKTPVRKQSPRGPGDKTGTKTVRKRNELEKRDLLARHVLARLNFPSKTIDTMRDVMAMIQEGTGVEAIGIRLREGDDFPYYVQNGFAKDFLKTENTLVVRAQDGQACRNEDGSICRECTCGLVLSGKTDSTNPLFTERGSFWTNNSLPLLELPADQDPRLHPRNRCIHDGYLSVAVIPLRTGGDIIGVLQLNDRRPGRFTLDFIRFLEGLATNLAMALKREQAEEKLQESEEKWRKLFAILPVGVSIFDAQNRIVDINPAVEKIFGLTIAEARKVFYQQYKFIRGDHTPMPPWQFPSRRAMLEQKTITDIEVGVVNGEGATTWALVSAAPLPFPDAACVVVTTDITERKRMERLLRERDESYRLLFEKIADGITIVDNETKRVMHANPAMCQMLGYTAEEMITKSILDLHPHDDLPFIIKGFENVGQGTSEGTVPLDLLRKDGTIIHAEMNVTVDILMGRKCNMAIFRDVTVRWQAEALLHNMKAELERQVELRTAELHRVSETLRQENQQRQDLEREVLEIGERERSRIGQDLHDSVGQAIAGIGYLISGVQHKLVKKGVPEAAEFERVGEVVEKTVQEVREMAHSLYPGEMKKGGIIAALRELALHTQGVFGIDCRFSGSPAIKVEDKTIESQFYRIAQESVNNAVKHSQTKTIRIKLFQKRGSLIMTIMDEGVGLAKSNSKKAGMGQRIMKHRAEMIGATLKVDGIRNKGTTVTCECSLKGGERTGK